jgi:uncharacterized membrane protein YphA (DoxX/SURF4 family)
MQGDFLIDLDESAGISSRVLRVAAWAVRIALAAAFASAVADRLGLWGPPGTPGVAWGNLERFNAYVAKLLWFLPAGLTGIVGWAATGAETLLALALLIGWQLRRVAFLSCCLLLLFGLAMTVALGLKPPLDYSVFTAASAAFLLFATQPADRKRS